MPAIMDTTINWDSNITKVSVIEEGGIGYEYTRSGEMTTLLANRPYTATVTLNSGYILDSVTTNEDGVTISNITDTTFIFKGITGTGPTITLTSKSNVSKVSIDLTTLTGWDNVSSGEHTIQVVAKATGYLDSAKSTAVSFTKASDKVLLEKGTYQFIENPTLPSVEKPIGDIVINGKMNPLTTNNTYGEMVDFKSIAVDNENMYINENSEDGNYIGYGESRKKWSYLDYSNDEAEYTATDTTKLRTIVLEADQQVSPEFYNWAITQGNLVKVEETTGETWVLNDNISSADRLSKVEISFTSNNEKYTGFQYERAVLSYFISDGSSTDIANVDLRGETTSWTNTAYKTITFETTPTGDLLTWLQANGTKQGGGAIAHKLTWSDSTMVVTVNGNAATSPYTLANGDTIVLKRTSGWQSINIITDTGSVDTDSTQSPLAVSNSDIKLQNGEVEKSPSMVLGFTINYEENANSGGNIQ